MIIAVDFDDTLERKGQPNMPLIARLRAEQHKGAIIILWTCRAGKRLCDAVSFCRQNGLAFNYINCNAPEGLRILGHDSRKIYADVYIDDKAMK